MKLEVSKPSKLTCAGLGLLLSCGKASSPQTSSSSHWLSCDDDDDCTVSSAGASCDASGFCVDSSGAHLEVGGASETAGVPHTILPETGTPMGELYLSMSQMVVDESEVVWAASYCEGLFAADGYVVKRYTWLDSPLPEGQLQLLVDAQNRTWVMGERSLSVVEAGAFRSIYSGPIGLFTVGRDGSAWIYGTDTASDPALSPFVRQVWPTLGETIRTPEDRMYSIAAAEPNTLWAANDNGVYRWDGQSWSSPSLSDAAFILYDPRHDVASFNGDRLRWNGSSFELDPTLDPSMQGFGQQIGFDKEGLLVLVNDTTVRWVADGEVERVQELPEFGRTLVGALGPRDDLYLATETALAKLSGVELSPVRAVYRFDPETQFAWRSQPFRQTLDAPSVDVTRAELAQPNATTFGTKLHVVGDWVGGFEFAALRIDDQVLPTTWVDAARETWTFMLDRGLSPITMADEATGEVPPSPSPWDLYGYLETGTCFGHDGGTTRQFWIVEAYPTSMPAAERAELASAFRERFPASTP